MMVLWLTLLLLHEGCTLTPVTTVQLGEPATFTCVSPDMLSNRIFWYKQSAGDALKLVVRLQKHAKPVFQAEFSASRFDVKVSENMSHLTILRTTEEDEGMYHCGVLEWSVITWSATYLSIEEQTTSSEFVALVIAIVCLVISVIGNIVFICHRSPRAACGQCKAVALQKNINRQSIQQSNKDTLVYSAVIFTMMRADSGAVKDATAVERERIYAAVKAFRLDQ
uniref:uncharacterized protein n=1 Tax=Semicossyphus pulcher TaxID=241346 RepID=UPI0037E92744